MKSNALHSLFYLISQAFSHFSPRFFPIPIKESAGAQCSSYIFLALGTKIWRLAGKTLCFRCSCIQFTKIFKVCFCVYILVQSCTFYLENRVEIFCRELWKKTAARRAVLHSEMYRDYDKWVKPQEPLKNTAWIQTCLRSSHFEANIEKCSISL